jgi:hypothetical protein
MSSARELLGWNFNEERFVKAAQEIAGPDVERNIIKATYQLENLINSAENVRIGILPDSSKLYRHFMVLCHNNQISQCKNFFGNPKQARKLSFILSFREDNAPAIAETKYINVALEILEAHWRDSMLVGLVYTLLHCWESPYAESLRYFVGEKFKVLRSQRPVLRKLQTNQRFFSDQNGPTLLGAQLISKDKPLSEIWNTLGFEANMVDAPYFSDVCIAYTQSQLRKGYHLQAIEQIVDFLGKHQQSKTSKLVLTLLLKKAELFDNQDFRDLLKEVAFRLIGDPENDAYWSPWDGASIQQAQQLKEAQAILNGWIIQQFINIFFDSLAMDSDRKHFWSKYLKHIRRFKIFGQEYMRSRLKLDQRIAPFLDTRFGLLEGNSDQNALVMMVKDFYLIEFSYSGSAFYAYPTTIIDAPDMSKHRLSINQLKPLSIRNQSKQLIRREKNYDIYLGRSIDGYEVQESGRLGHSGNWQERLSYWLKKQIGI